MHILITGATSGIGKQLALLLSLQGHSLSVCGRSAEKLQTLVADMSPTPFHHAFCLSNRSEIASFCDAAAHKNGPVDVLINCAGLNNNRQQADVLDLNDLDWMIKINSYAPIQFMQSVLPAMKCANQGLIINVLSTTCLYSNPGIAGYTASKATLDAYIKVMRKELLQNYSGIKMTAVYPGGVDTDFRSVERPQYLSAYDVATTISSILNLPEALHQHEMVFRPACEQNL